MRESGPGALRVQESDAVIERRRGGFVPRRFIETRQRQIHRAGQEVIRVLVGKMLSERERLRQMAGHLFGRRLR